MPEHVTQLSKENNIPPPPWTAEITGRFTLKELGINTEKYSYLSAARKGSLSWISSP